MPAWIQILISVIGGLLLLWLLLVALLWRQQRRTGDATDWREVARLVPDVIRLIRRLATDRSIPRATRVWLWALLVYLLSPIDLIPDFIPVLGYADDAIIVAIALRYAIRHAGADAIQRAWPGTPAGLRTVFALVGI